MSSDDDSFYEDDEPIEDIRARQARPYDFVTAPPRPRRGVTLNYFPAQGTERWPAHALSAQNEGACR